GGFGTDEAAFAGVVPAVRPRAVAVTSLFRDQLDRYGEVDTVAALWRSALEEVRSPKSEVRSREPADLGLRTSAPMLVLNADDPTVAALGHGREDVIYWGIDDVRWGKP